MLDKRGKFFVALRGADSGDRGEQRLDRFAPEVAGDEDEARAAVAVGPVFELDRAVRDMLDRLNHHRPAHPFVVTP